MIGSTSTVITQMLGSQVSATSIQCPGDAATLQCETSVGLCSAFHASKGRFSPTPSNPYKHFPDMLSASKRDRHIQRLNARNSHRMHCDFDKLMDGKKVRVLWNRQQWVTAQACQSRCQKTAVYQTKNLQNKMAQTGYSYEVLCAI